MTPSPQILVVGRRNESEPYDIEIPAGEKSVSRPHLELTITEDGRYYLCHVGKNSTQVRLGGRWRNLLQDFVEADTPLRLGDFETTVSALLQMRREDGQSQAVSARADSPVVSEPPRNRRKVQVWDPDKAQVTMRYEDEI